MPPPGRAKLVNPYAKRKTQGSGGSRPSISSAPNAIKQPTTAARPNAKLLPVTNSAKPATKEVLRDSAKQNNNADVSRLPVIDEKAKRNDAGEQPKPSSNANASSSNKSVKQTQRQQKPVPVQSQSDVKNASLLGKPKENEAAANSNKVGTAAKLTKAALPLARQSQQQPKSLRAKLTQQIEELKRKTLLEKQKKQLRKEQKALEKKKREQERLQAIEDEKRRKQQEEEEKRQMALREEQEKIRREREQVEAERQKKLQAERQQHQLMLRQQHQQYAALFGASAQMMYYGGAPAPMYPLQNQVHTSSLTHSVPPPPPRPYYPSLAPPPPLPPPPQASVPHQQHPMVPYFSGRPVNPMLTPGIPMQQQQPQQQQPHQPYPSHYTAPAIPVPSPTTTASRNTNVGATIHEKDCASHCTQGDATTGQCHAFQHSSPTIPKPDPTAQMNSTADQDASTSQDEDCSSGSIQGNATGQSHSLQHAPPGTPLPGPTTQVHSRGGENASLGATSQKKNYKDVATNEDATNNNKDCSHSNSEGAQPDPLERPPNQALSQTDEPSQSGLEQSTALGSNIAIATDADPKEGSAVCPDTIKCTGSVGITEESNPSSGPSGSSSSEQRTSTETLSVSADIDPQTINADKTNSGQTVPSQTNSFTPKDSQDNNGLDLAPVSGQNNPHLLETSPETVPVVEEAASEIKSEQNAKQSVRPTTSTTVISSTPQESSIQSGTALVTPTVFSCSKNQEYKCSVAKTPTEQMVAKSQQTPSALWNGHDPNSPLVPISHTATYSTGAAAPSKDVSQLYNNTNGYHASSMMHTATFPLPFQHRSAQGYAPVQMGNNPYLVHASAFQGDAWHQHFSSGQNFVNPLYSCPGSWNWQQQPFAPYPQGNSANFATNGMRLPNGGYPTNYAAPYPGLQATPYQRRPQGRPKKPAPTVFLAKKPLELPSPYALSHALLEQTFVIVKKPGESFGLSVREEQQSALVEPEWVLQNDLTQKKTSFFSITSSDGTENRSDVPSQNDATKTDASSASSSIGGQQKPTRKRRKRHFFLVITVMDATSQNSRNPASQHLFPGDIIVSINGEGTGGLQFRDACSLFSNCNEPEKDANGTDIVRCSIKIARKKPTPQAHSLPRAAPIVTLTDTFSIAPLSVAHHSTPLPLTEAEVETFAACVIRALLDPQRMLGTVLSDSLLGEWKAMFPKLADRDLSVLKGALLKTGRTFEERMMERAIDFWKREAARQNENLGNTSSRSFFTLAQRSELRSAPRPIKGCKCGSTEHEYVNDEQCPLYNDLRSFFCIGNDESPSEQGKEKMKKSTKRSFKTVVETAFVDRFLKLQSEKKALEAEASFVDEMEKLQIEKLKKAIVSPSLTTMVLSAVIELQSEFPFLETKKEDNPDASAIARDEANVDNSAVDGRDDDMDGDDDIPLFALGKRSGAAQKSSPNKKQKMSHSSRMKYRYLAKVLLFISERWGHVYREPGHSDYAWRWETYHAVIEEDKKWDANTSNPRSAGHLTFENIPFVLTEAVVEALAKYDTFGLENSTEQDALALLAHFLSPTRTGVLDELLSLVQVGILSLEEGGIPRLTKDWYTRCDLLLLQEMEECWGQDDKNIYCVSRKIRRKLGKEWVRREHGWALRDDPETIVYDLDEYEEWREALESKKEEKSDDINGIGRFGI